MPDDLIDTAEACEILGGLNRSTVSRWVKFGDMTPERRIGSAFVFKRSEVMRMKRKLDAEAAAKTPTAVAS